MYVILGKCFLCFMLLVVMYIALQMAKDSYSVITNLDPEPSKPLKTGDKLIDSINQSEYRFKTERRKEDKLDGIFFFGMSILVLIALCVPLIMIIIS